jgi:uncharacterized membrane protein YphA (DoxX/SURF4 family)
VKDKAINVIKRVCTHRYFNCGLRVAIGIVLLTAGIGKAASGHSFVNVVSSLKILPYPLIAPVGTALPWFEIALGTLFILGLFTRFAAGIGLPLFAAFMVTNIFNIYRGITEPCSSCFGNYLLLSARDALIIDMALLVAAFRVMILENYSISLDALWIRRTRPAEIGQ